MHTSFSGMKSAIVILCLSFSLAGFSQAVNDQLIKTNITPISSPLSQVNALQPRSFEYNSSQYPHLKLPGGVHYGFVAEEFRQVFPTLVHQRPHSFMAGKNSYKRATTSTIDTNELVAILVAAVQEQQMQIDKLREEVRQLKR